MKPASSVEALQPPLIVDQTRAEFQRAARHGGLGRVDRNRHRTLRREQFKDRHDPAQFFVRGNWGVSRPSRLAAKIDDVGALLDHGERVCDRLRGVRVSTAVGK